MSGRLRSYIRLHPWIGGHVGLGDCGFSPQVGAIFFFVEIRRAQTRTPRISLVSSDMLFSSIHSFHGPIFDLFRDYSIPTNTSASAFPLSLAKHHRQHSLSSSTFATLTTTNGTATASGVPTCPTYTSIVLPGFICPVSDKRKREVCPEIELGMTITSTATVPCSCPASTPTTTVSACPVFGCERHSTVTQTVGCT